MVKNLRPSKRMCCRRKYKIIKKIAKHNKKLRKEQHTTRKHRLDRKRLKNLGVPNSFPFKDEILIAAATKKQEEKDMQEKIMNEKAKPKKKKDVVREEDNNLSSVLDKDENKGDKAFKSKYKQLNSVIKEADIILEVLDARDPLGYRCPQLESMVMNLGKRLVLVLNKIDLIPRKNLHEWLAYLQKELPTVAFKASSKTKIQPRKKYYKPLTKDPAVELYEKFQAAKQCIGGMFLMKVIKNCRLNLKMKKIKIGVVGFPNVGKKSIINCLDHTFNFTNLEESRPGKSLKRSQSCSRSLSNQKVPDFLREVELKNCVHLFRCPGIICAEGDTAKKVLRNDISFNLKVDFIEAAEAIMKRVNKLQLSMHYCIPEVSSMDELFQHLARKTETLKKGTPLTNNMIAFKLIDDLNKGKIKYYTHPPEEYQQSTHLNADYIAHMKETCDVSKLEHTELDKVRLLFPSDAIEMALDGTTDMILIEGLSSEEESDPEMGEPESDDDFYKSKELTVNFELKRSVVAENAVMEKNISKVPHQQKRKKKGRN